MKVWNKGQRWIFNLLVAYVLLFISFSNDANFWYMYTFSVLLLMSLVFLQAKVFDEVQTWEYLLFGVGYGTFTYGLIAFGYYVFNWITPATANEVEQFLAHYGPTSIWQFLLLILFIAPGEELFWRGFIQQKLKNYMKPRYAVLVAAILFGLSLSFSGFWLGVLAGILSGLFWGFLYEWKRSMPLLIVAHITMTILLFLVLPLIK